MAEETTAGTNEVTRRKALTGSGALIAGAALGFSGLWGVSEADAAPRKGNNHNANDTVATIINLAATAELLATTTYYTALTQGSLGLDARERRFLTAALEHELTHFRNLTALGAKPVATSFFTVQTMFTDRSTFVGVLDLAETYFIGAYLAASRRFAELQADRFAWLATQTAVVEGQHLALIRGMGGLLEDNLDYAQPVFYNVSDVVPKATPFLVGGTGFEGPTPAPSFSAVDQFLANNPSGSRKVPLAIQVF